MIAKGVPVVISTRVYNGRVMPVYGYIGGGNTLKQLGAIFADNLTPQKARPPFDAGPAVNFQRRRNSEAV